MLKYVIIVAVIAFLIALIVIYFKEIKAFFKNKFGKKKPKQIKQKSPEKTTLTVEDFKPIEKNYDQDTRDNSLNELFLDDDFAIPSLNDEGANSFNSEEPDEDFEDFFAGDFGKGFSSPKNDFNSFNDIFGSKKERDDRSIDEKIKSLPPEIKALLIDNVLKKRDDV